jgi:uncharacterized membrane protein YeaQ/YmgE (transglycosylase-associated protein family)
MHILFWIIVGIVAGALARMAVPAGERGGIGMDLVVGLVGALIGGWVFTLFGVGGGGWLWSILTAFVGACILLAIVRAFNRPHRV